MIPRYALVNEVEKTSFEKKWHLPYGYIKCALATDEKTANQWLEKIISLGENPYHWYVEKIDEYDRRITLP